MIMKTKKIGLISLIVGMMLIVQTVLAVGPETNPNPNWGDINPSGATTGHANPALSWQGWIYPGTDDCGFENGASTIGSPATLPDSIPFPQAPW